MRPATIHQAGTLVGGVQLCTRCGFILSDYRGAMLLDSEELAPRGWPVGAFLEVVEGTPRFMTITHERPNCEMEG